jgi:hypothetical protein
MGFVRVVANMNSSVFSNEVFGRGSLQAGVHVQVLWCHVP